MEVFSSIGRGIQGLSSSIGNFFLAILIYFRKFCLNWYKFIIPAMLVGLGIGISFNFITYTSYESEATIKSTFLKGANFLNEIDKLDKLCSDPISLAKVLNLEDSEAISLKSITAQGFNSANNIYEQYGANEETLIIKDSLIRYDLVNEEIFKVNISTYNELLEPTKIQSALKTYLENNEYLVKEFEINKNGLLKEKALIENQLVEINKLRGTLSEAIKVRIEKEKAGEIDDSAVRIMMDNGKSSLKNEDIPVILLDKDLALTQQLNEISSELYLTEKIQFITPFNAFYSKSYSRPTYGILGASIGFGIIFLIAILLDINSFLEKKSKESNYKKY
ncbi:hypothetical protein [Sediminitomix flava]|nr:hypothetical protein [Sediminitomix flava]